MSIVHSRMPLSVPPVSRLQNGQTGYSEVLTTPAANAATLADYVDGLGGYGAMLNPSSEYGHDHSGGFFGRPMFVTVASATMHGAQGEIGVIYPAKFYQIYIENSAGGTQTVDTEPPIPVWVPNCDLVDGAYRQLAVRLRINITNTGLDASDTLQIIVHLAQYNYAFTVSSPNVTGERYIGTASSSQLVGTVPGAVNNVYLEGKVDRVAGGASRGCIINVHEIEFGVYST